MLQSTSWSERVQLIWLALKFDEVQWFGSFRKRHLHTTLTCTDCTVVIVIMFGNGYMHFVIGFASAVSVIAMTGNPYLKAVLQYAFRELIEKKRRNYITGTLDQIKPCHGVPSLVKSIETAILILQIARSAIYTAHLEGHLSYSTRSCRREVR